MEDDELPGGGLSNHLLEGGVVEDNVIDEDEGMMVCGVGHIFGSLPFTFTSLKVGASSRPRETMFVYICRAVLYLATVLSVAVVVLYHFTADKEGVNKTDAYAPIAVQLLLVTWLTLDNILLLNLQNEWRNVCAAVRQASSPPRSHIHSYDEDEQLVDLQSDQVIDLRLPLRPAPIDPLDGSTVETALMVIKKIAYRGCQTAKYSPLFKGIPVLPESGNYYKCLIAGLVLSVSQVFLIRMYFGTNNSYSDYSSMALAVWWLSTIHFGMALFLFYSLLTLIVTSYRQQYLLMRRFSCMLVQQRAARNKLPYFILNTTENMQAWYAVRQFLLQHITGPNALGVVLDPTFALLGIGVLASSTVLIIRQLFEGLEIDLFSGGCFNLLGASAAYMACVAYYGLKIQSHISSHAEILAHIQWEITRKWNEVLEALENSPPESRSEKAAERARKLWILRRYTNGLMDTCHRDTQHPKILKASFSNMRWWLIFGLLVLNTVLFFALRTRNNSPAEPPAVVPEL
eukprot:TRINITY_DN1052_c0_g2_i2.p1 TRINITY_DN1052_c0_g2~~TRINITY_DN1052_c0_g2_i2.p1  ORF type:complete len:515 (+),score=114.28 TRINITY_DN1052_c0_g2_i2:430-1974(+)